jgi:putative ABC transport system permease protein
MFSLLRLSARGLLRRPFQTALCVLGVALGVAVVVAIDLANSSASRAFHLSSDTVTGKATHEITGVNNNLDQEVYRRVRVDLGVRNSAPVIDLYANAVELNNQTVHVLGVDVFAEPPFRTLAVNDAQSVARTDFSQFISRPDTVLLSSATARRANLTVGDTLTLRVGGVKKPLRIVGLIESRADTNQALDDIVLMDIGTAQETFGMIGKLTRVDLIADERTPEGRELLDRIRAILPPDAQIGRPAARSASIESISDAFELNLSALSLLALVVGMFLIYNTITFSVVQRRGMFGTLRCLGVVRREIFMMVLSEALLIALVGGALGLLLGIALGRGAGVLVTRTINDLYYSVNVRDVSVSWPSLVKGYALGIFAALAAALAPAYEATSVPPISVMRRSLIEQRVGQLLPKLFIVGVVLMAVGAALLLLSHSLIVNFGGIFVAVLGAALISPLIVSLFTARLVPFMSRIAGVIGRIAARGIAGSLSRTAVAIAAMMIAVSVITGLQSMIDSFRRTVELWLGQTLVADVYVTSGIIGNERNGSISSDIALDLSRLPQVELVESVRRSTVEFAIQQSETNSGKRAAVLASDNSPLLDARNTVWNLDGAAQQQRTDAMRGKQVIAVSEPFANRNAITPQNNHVLLRTAQGWREFEVRGVFYDYGSDQGLIVMRRDLYASLWGDDKITSLGVHLKPDAQLAPFLTELRRRYAGETLVITSNVDLRKNALGVFDRTFAITGALNFLSTLVAVIGMLSALMALQIERTREFGTLRANGMTLPQLWRMQLIETGLLGSIAGVLALPLGLMLAIVLIYIINLRSFGWTIQLNLQWTTFAQALAVAIGSALVATLYPSWRLRALKIAQAVRQE